MHAMVVKTPNTIDELLACMKEANENTYYISGGTDFMIKLRKNRIYSGTIIDLKGIPALRYIKKEDGMIRIGGNTTFTEIVGNEIMQKHAACVVQAASQIGSTQIRNAATIGGNVANAFAGADSIPAFMVLDAKIVVLKADGESYKRDMDGIVLGAGQNSLGHDEVIVEIQIPVLDEGYKTAFAKIGSRSRVTIAKLNMAAVVKCREDGSTIEEARIVLGALGPKAFRSRKAEEVLIGRTISKDLCMAFQNVLTAQVDESIASRSSWAYKREAVKGLADEVFDKLFQDVLTGGRT